MLLAGLCAAATGNATDKLRCGSKLIDTGMTADEVRAQCGEPASVRVETVPVYARNRSGGVRQTGTARIEYWVYDRGSNQFPARLKFEESRLVSIELELPGESPGKSPDRS